MPSRGWTSEDEFEIRTLPESLHRRILDWQRRTFADEYEYLLRRWSDFYPAQPPFRLVAKLGPLPSPVVEVGCFRGRPRFERAAELDEEMILQTARIIKAQCSTELGSIQQHRESLAKAQDARAQFNVMRVMAEEFRHAYQMLYVLASDDWTQVGKDVAGQTVEQLLAMRTGEHVLDAFNLFFDSFVDNVVFAAVIDRVGKYQLEMQRAFSYAPMARSMGPMLYEEAFHISTGIHPLRRWAAEAARDEGNVSTEMIQKHLNKWIPRGLEMFGDERGGKTVVELGFKDRLNGEAQAQYYEELQTEVIDALNYEVLRVFDPSIDRLEAPAVAARILATGEAWKGCSREKLFYRPSPRFFRRRGVHAFETCDVEGKPIRDLSAYLCFLRRNLPDAYITGPDFKVYVDNLRASQAGHDVKEEGLPFYG
jgi:1,2-phenylacetyl-CoA epoxidase catalytic subunit